MTKYIHSNGNAGNGIEPGGREVQDHFEKAKCPSCGGEDAVFQAWEEAESGCINNLWTLVCDCGHSEGNDIFSE